MQRAATASIIAAVILGVAAVAAPSLYRSLSIDFTPALDADLVESMQWLERNSPENALVWGAWDQGYALRYWSRRATVSDGSIHGGEIAVYTGLPFAAEDFQLAANFMQFYSVHGQPGMQRIHRPRGKCRCGPGADTAAVSRRPGAVSRHPGEPGNGWSFWRSRP